MGSHYKGPKEEVRALNTYIKLVRATDSINNKINLFLSESKLTTSQFFVLDALFHLGPLSQKELGKKLLKSGGNITMVIDNLEHRGFVKRERSKQDRRLIYIHLSTVGAKQVKNVLPDFVSVITKEMKKINSEEHKELQKLCKKIGIRN